MKKNMIVLICWACALAVNAQDSLQPGVSSGKHGFQTLFNKESAICKIPLGFFIEFSDGYTQMGHKSVFLPGFSTGVILNHHWTVGMMANVIGNPGGVEFHHHHTDSTGTRTSSRSTLKGGYGGLLLEYTLLPKSKVHVSFPLMIGCGYMTNSWGKHINDSIDYSEDYTHHHSGDHFFVIEPGVKLELNVIKTLRIGFGISYRYVPDLDLKHNSPDMLDQFTGKLSFRFGKF